MSERTMAIGAIVMAVVSIASNLAMCYYARQARRHLDTLARCRGIPAGPAGAASASPLGASDFFSNDGDRDEWRDYLAGFLVEVYPVFEPIGISLAEALIIWQINRVRNGVLELGTDPDEDAPWKQA